MTEAVSVFDSSSGSGISLLLKSLVEKADEYVLLYTDISIIINALCLGLYIKNRAAVNTHTQPDFFMQIDAGSILTSVCWESVAYCEQEGTRDYMMAIRLLLLLLTSPYCTHRRGKVFLDHEIL